jgi:alpha/beta hydrolase family protein
MLADTLETGARHIVVLVHGIRTFGGWQDRLAALLHEHQPGVEVHVYKYGYLDALAFLLPGLRATVIHRFRRYLADRVAVSQGARIDIVAHSFGTYVVGWALRRLSSAARPKIHTVILCGSVLKQLFPWSELVGPDMWVRRLVNECGRSDYWPVIAQLLVFGMGVAGRRGFAGVTGLDVGIMNRDFAVDHSGFFTDAFMQEHWTPLLTRSAPPPESELVVPVAGWSAGLEYFADPLKLVILLLPLVAILFWWQVERANVAVANAKAAESDAKAAKSDKLAAEAQLETVKARADGPSGLSGQMTSQNQADTSLVTNSKDTFALTRSIELRSVDPRIGDAKSVITFNFYSSDDRSHDS